MTAITLTKRTRGKVTLKIYFDKGVKKMKQKIIGYEKAVGRVAFKNPRNPNQFVLLSPGQIFNWGKAISRKRIIYKIK